LDSHLHAEAASRHLHRATAATMQTWGAGGKDGAWINLFDADPKGTIVTASWAGRPTAYTHPGGPKKHAKGVHPVTAPKR